MTQPPGNGTPAGGGTADQSMEDILASIRRILNEDEATPAPATATPASAEPDPGPLILTEEMMVSPPAAPAEPAEPPAAIPAEPVAAAADPLAPVPESPPRPETLLAPAVAAAAAASVGRLLQAVSADRGATVSRAGPSIEDVVREELRPLLKDWLDQHLPAIVERLVRAEIERVVGRALG